MVWIVSVGDTSWVGRTVSDKVVVTLSVENMETTDETEELSVVDIVSVAEREAVRVVPELR